VSSGPFVEAFLPFSFHQSTYLLPFPPPAPSRGKRLFFGRPSISTLFPCRLFLPPLGHSLPLPEPFRIFFSGDLWTDSLSPPEAAPPPGDYSIGRTPLHAPPEPSRGFTFPLRNRTSLASSFCITMRPGMELPSVASPSEALLQKYFL